MVKGATGGTLDMTRASAVQTLTRRLGLQAASCIRKLHKANRHSVLLPVFAGLIEMVVAAFGELV